MLGGALAAATACKRSEAEPATPLWERVETDPKLERGRQVWAANCKRCHAYGIEGAPRIGDAAAWGPLAGKGLPTLVKSVIEGVQGKAGGEMPPRAGNDALTDTEIEEAVAYVLAVSR